MIRCDGDSYCTMMVCVVAIWAQEVERSRSKSRGSRHAMVLGSGHDWLSEPEVSEPDACDENADPHGWESESSNDGDADCMPPQFA